MDTPTQTVLCIEDDRFIGEMYVRALNQAGYKVDWVLSGNDGLAAAKSKPYDYILLDLMLPEKKGNDVINELRGEKNLIPDTKVLILTNFDEDDASRNALQEKVEAYLIKADITPRKLLEIIKEL
ncbi:response regulator receiver protein [Candidatus Saccharibacteria bacterium RIFCSPHIGHO2_12_FULL_42_8]|nr:MAG: response regulator receiver protein [Candidatus Saccharibacteria bacterium RIFCSPHIGHO2_12_FULL_42_8]